MGITYPKKTMYAMLSDAAQRHPKAMAYSFMGKKTDYKRLMQRIEHVAAGLYALGIGKGDRVTVCMPNMPQAVDCVYALNRLGAVANMIHPLCADRELRFYMEISRSKAILTLDSFYEKVAAAAGDAMILVATVKPELPVWKRLFYREKKVAGGIRWQSLYKFPVGLPPAATDSASCACILYSGGTTGKPKGVCLSSDNFNAAGLQTLKASGYQSFVDMKMLAIMPIFHGFGLGVGIHTPLIAGAGCILVPRFSLKTFAKLVKKERPAFLPGVPSLFEAMLRSEELRDTKLDFLKGIFCGGDTLSPELKSRVDAFLQEHGCREQLREGYGMTESVSVTGLTPRYAAKSGTIGLPLEDMHYQIVTPGTVEPVPTGQAGEICVSGPTVMMGYLDDPEETAQTLRTHPDGQLWLHTGDLGSMDPDGYIRFHQRIKRMIVTNGYNVYPSRLEQILKEHPQVADACVVGVPNAHRGQLVKAFIVPKAAPSEQLRQQILTCCRQSIAKYAMPRELEFCQEIPKTPLGKVDYKKMEQ